MHLAKEKQFKAMFKTTKMKKNGKKFKEIDPLNDNFLSILNRNTANKNNICKNE